jgi:hypothetical protein
MRAVCSRFFLRFFRVSFAVHAAPARAGALSGHRPDKGGAA